jgi:hypothetical protein
MTFWVWLAQSARQCGKPLLENEYLSVAKIPASAEINNFATQLNVGSAGVNRGCWPLKPPSLTAPFHGKLPEH